MDDHSWPFMAIHGHSWSFMGIENREMRMQWDAHEIGLFPTLTHDPSRPTLHKEFSSFSILLHILLTFRR